MAAMGLLFDRVQTPIGEAVIVCDGAGRLCLLDWNDCEARWRGYLQHFAPEEELIAAKDPFGLARALEAYFDGEPQAVAKLAVVEAGTAFRNRVWRALRKIEPGSTLSYGALAQKLGSAPRAVGAACGANPVSIVIPCHRVVGANGSLTGYAGGLDRKGWLLAHEARMVEVMAD